MEEMRTQTIGGKTFEIVDAKARETLEQLQKGGTGGGSGATFTPAVSEDGTLSWTNDKGLDNPEPVNIKGPQGVSPTVRSVRAGSVTTVSVTDAKGGTIFEIYDGEPGADGVSGRGIRLFDNVAYTIDDDGYVSSAAFTSGDEVGAARGDFGLTPSGDLYTVEDTAGIFLKVKYLYSLKGPQGEPGTGGGGTGGTVAGVSVARNLLDNSYWKNPINQRGQTSYTDKGYTIDRWTKESTYTRPHCTLNEGYTTITNDSADYNYYLIQRLEAGTLKVGSCYTAAVKHHDGTTFCGRMVVPSTGRAFAVDSSHNLELAIGYTGGYEVFCIYMRKSSSIDVEWVALYEGEYTAETLPEYQYKGYAAELLECQRYFQRLNAKAKPHVSYNAVLAGSNAIILAPIPISPMRMIPTCVLPTGATITVAKSPGGSVVSSINEKTITDVIDVIYSENDHHVAVTLNVTYSGTVGTSGYASFGTSGAGYIDLSADL